jgi:hypothetical protein
LRSNAPETVQDLYHTRTRVCMSAKKRYYEALTGGDCRRSNNLIHEFGRSPKCRLASHVVIKKGENHERN